MVFKDCVFEGEIREAQFYRHAFRGESFPPNEMDGVDFRGASLSFVRFGRMDLKNVRFPENDAHILIEEYRPTLERMLAALQGKTDLVRGSSPRCCATS